MVKSNLVTLGIVLGILGLLLIGGAYLSFSQASESFDESMENSDAGCESFFGFCWFLPGGSFGCGFCLLGILLGFLTMGFLFSGSIFAIVGATLQTPDSVIVVEFRFSRAHQRERGLYLIRVGPTSAPRCARLS